MTQPKITLNQLKQYLKKISQEESIADITELFKRFPSVKEYYQIKLYPQAEKEVLAKYKKMIEDEFSLAGALVRLGFLLLRKLFLTIGKCAITK